MPAVLPVYLSFRFVNSYHEGKKLIVLFEKILPQLLYYLAVEKTTAEDSIDWGTLLIYSCSKSCSLTTDGSVKEEFFFFFQLERLR